ncbi:MAG TPA: hypothetical protein DCG12_11430 [Planctomycetaceae bacterium]|nr:hypothetical protein [Planctomycetaceae bacterium]
MDALAGEENSGAKKPDDISVGMIDGRKKVDEYQLMKRFVETCQHFFHWPDSSLYGGIVHRIPNRRI